MKNNTMKGLLEVLPKPASEKTGWPWTEETSPSSFDVNRAYPKISIVTPSYNQGQFIEETIRSVLLQNYPNLEYIVIDGGSTDNSVDIIKKYAPWLTYWVSEKDRGQSHAINKGFEKATGQLFAWMNSDDFYAKSALFEISSCLDSEFDLYVGIGHKVNLGREIIYSPNPSNLGLKYFINWGKGNNFMQPAAFFTKRAFRNVGGLDESYNYGMDVDLWIKLAKHYKLKKIEKTLAYAYEHVEAKTTAEIPEMHLEFPLMLARNGHLDEAKSILRDIKKNVYKQAVSNTSFKNFLAGKIKARWRWLLNRIKLK